MSRPDRVLMLGLDAAEYGIVQTLIRAGRMPRLAKLMRTGVSGSLSSPADLYAGGVWPSFYTGTRVSSHGVFHNKQWRPETMRVEVPTGDWTCARPFWEAWDDSEIDTVILDVPMVLGEPRTTRGVYVGGWGTHDLIARGSWPRPVWRDLEYRFGRPVMPRECWGLQSERSLKTLASNLRLATEQVGSIALDLLERYPWRFACIVFGAAHRAGHYLWDRSQLTPRAERQATAVAGDADLLGIYECLDAAVGRVVGNAPDGTLFIAFALHGMGPNPGWSDLLPAIIGRMETHRSGSAPKQGWLYRLKQSLPYQWTRPLLSVLPTAATDRLVELWSKRMYDWSATRYFPVPMDEAGYLRVNLRGRERDGIVDPGPAYDDVCDDIERLVSSLCDEATGHPIAGPVLRAYREADSACASRRLVPDLVFPWIGPTATDTRRLISTALPGFGFDVPDRLPSGRSGNHTGRGWFIASGPGVRTGADVNGYDIVDLLPTILASLGREPDPRLPGHAIAEIVGQ